MVGVREDVAEMVETSPATTISASGSSMWTCSVKVVEEATGNKQTVAMVPSVSFIWCGLPECVISL